MKKRFRILSQKISWAVLVLLTGFYTVVGAEAPKATTPLIEQLEKSRQAYEDVRDYTALFIKEERSEGKLDPPEEIFLKFEKPFKIYMKWLNPPKKGLEVHYERGKHDNKLAIHKPGFLTGLAGVIFLEQDSPWVRAGSEAYDIEDAGIGTFLFDFTAAVLKGSHEGRLKVDWLDANTANVIFDVPGKDGVFFARHCVVTFDGGSKLPVKMKLFDWNSRLLGEYDYQNLKINVGAQDTEFMTHIHRSLYRVWNHRG